MINMKAIKRFIIPVLLLIVTVAAIASTPRLRSLIFAAPSPAGAPEAASKAEKKYSEVEEELFSELAGLYNRAGAMRAYLAEGSIRLTDQADTSRSMFTRFRYCRKESLNYYQLGDQEILNVPGLTLTINHSIKKMFMSPRDTGAAMIPMVVDSKGISALKGEGYEITREYSDPLTVIRLKKENHISCREYRVAYDSSGYIRRVFIRNADEHDPTDLSLDKLISVNITNWQMVGLPEQLLSVNRYIQKDGESWVPAPAYRNYEIRYIY